MEAVIFDLGGTLINTAPIPEIIRRILSAYGIKRPLDEIAKAEREAEEGLTLEDYSLPYREFWLLWNVKILRALKICRDVEILADALTENWWDNAGLELYPDVEEALNTIMRRRLKMGIVTNGFKKDIEEILTRTNLTGFFDVTVGVDAVGKPKPHKEIFLYALERLGVIPEEAIFVGDDPRNDYEGAEKAGMKALLIDREDKIRGKLRKIRDLREIEFFLE